MVSKNLDFPEIFAVVEMIRGCSQGLAATLKHVAQIAKYESGPKNPVEMYDNGAKTAAEAGQFTPTKPQSYQNKEPDRAIAKKHPGRPKVTQEEANERRKIKADWERYRDTIKGANKKENFCKDYDKKDMTVEYLNNSVLRWCRDHPE